MTRVHQTPRTALVELKAVGLKWNGPPPKSNDELLKRRHDANFTDSLHMIYDSLKSEPDERTRMVLAVEQAFFCVTWAAFACPTFDVDPLMETSFKLTTPPAADWVRPPFPSIVVRTQSNTFLAWRHNKPVITDVVGHGIATWKDGGWVVTTENDIHDPNSIAVDDDIIFRNLCAYVSAEKPTIAAPRKNWEERKKGYRATKISAVGKRRIAQVNLQRLMTADDGQGGSRCPHVVRGHWRQQCHGKRWSLRRLTWIEPFEKGVGTNVKSSPTYQVTSK